jgi:hypothetical protein
MLPVARLVTGQKLKSRFEFRRRHFLLFLLGKLSGIG